MTVIPSKEFNPSHISYGNSCPVISTTQPAGKLKNFPEGADDDISFEIRQREKTRYQQVSKICKESKNRFNPLHFSIYIVKSAISIRQRYWRGVSGLPNEDSVMKESNFRTPMALAMGVCQKILEVVLIVLLESHGLLGFKIICPLSLYNRFVKTTESLKSIKGNLKHLKTFFLINTKLKQH